MINKTVKFFGNLVSSSVAAYGKFSSNAGKFKTNLTINDGPANLKPNPY